jgi:hypothetical protein
MLKLVSNLKAKYYLADQRQIVFSTPKFAFSAYANHRDSEDNLPETPFEFTDESYAAIEVLKKKYPTNYKSSCVIPVLFIA